MRALFAAGVAALVLCSVGCAGTYRPATAYPRPPLGFVYGHNSAPLQVDFEGESLGAKRGTATTHWLRDIILTGLPLAAWGEASIEAAARDGGITEVKHADYEIMNVLGVYMAFTVHVYGD